MQQKKNIILTFLAFIVIASLYRIIPGRPVGFAPQIAIALFAGAASGSIDSATIRDLAIRGNHDTTTRSNTT
jgi:hypothetical protein